VYDRYDNPICTGVTKDRSSLLKALKRLEKLGLITTVRSGKTNRYRLMLDNIKEFYEDVASKLKEAKQAKKRKESDVVGKHTNEVVGNHTNTSKGYKVTDINYSNVSDENVAEAMEKAKNKTLKARQTKANKNANKLTAASLPLHWNVAISIHYPEGTYAPSRVPSKEFNMLRSAYGVNTPDIPVAMFIEWVIKSWSKLRGHEMSWASAMGTTPDINVFCRMYRHFYKAYNTTAANERLNQEKRGGDVEGVHTLRRAEAAEREARDLRGKLNASETAREHYRRIAQTKKTRKPRKKAQVVPSELAGPLGEWEAYDEGTR